MASLAGLPRRAPAMPMTNARFLRMAAGALALAVSLPAHAAIRYVDAGLASGANNGTSWGWIGILVPSEPGPIV